MGFQQSQLLVPLGALRGAPSSETVNVLRVKPKKKISSRLYRNRQAHIQRYSTVEVLDKSFRKFHTAADALEKKKPVKKYEHGTPGQPAARVRTAQAHARAHPRHGRARGSRLGSVP